MSDNPLAVGPFFLTRQVANLMEDFARETSHSSSLFLLYGDGQVGKTRLLNELEGLQFSGKVVHRIDFNLDKNPSEGEDSTAGDGTEEVADKIQALVKEASSQDIIILDHFEAASNTTRHQVFQSWATDGLDRNLNIILVADSDQLKDLQQLAAQYQANVKSFQLKPFSGDEVNAFVLHYLFPPGPAGDLVIPVEIRKQLKISGGAIGRIKEILSREEVATSIKLADKSVSNKYPIIAAGIALVILVLFVSLYPVSDQQDVLPQQTSDEVISSPVTLPDEVVKLNNDESSQEELATEPVIAETAPDIVETETALAVSEQPEYPVTEISQENAVVVPGEVVEDNPILPKLESDQAQQVTDNSQMLTRFQQDLNRSLDWINNGDKDRGTIQIMSIGFGSSAEKAYYNYLDKMTKQDIDVSRIKIYQTVASGVLVYSVVFNEYENRREANKGIQLLPDALKANRPIPRTIGGIRDEISNHEQNTL